VSEPVYRDDYLEVYGGDARATLAELEASSVDCVVTSPPYWGLRDYGLPSVEWGDGWVGQLGLEDDPDAYVAHLVEVLRSIRRVLKPAGTLWLNLGDSYASKPRGSDNGWDRSRLTNPGRTAKAQRAAMTSTGERHRGRSAGIKAKDLVGVPWAVAFAARADGWYLRADIVWAKPNPMPEPVDDRPTRSHEYVFLLTPAGNPTYWTHADGRRVDRKPRADFRWVHRETGEISDVPVVDPAWMRVNLWTGHDYYYDAEAIREEATSLDDAKVPQGWDDRPGTHGNVHREGRSRTTRYSDGRWPRGWAHGADRGHDPQVGRYSPNLDRPSVAIRSHGLGRLPPNEIGRTGTRNRRSVWTVPTEPYPEAHFATFPRRLIEPMILAGAPEGGVVLDPFAGSGTVGLVAQALGRRAILVDLNPEYVRQALRRAARSFGVGGRDLEDRSVDGWPAGSLWHPDGATIAIGGSND